MAITQFEAAVIYDYENHLNGPREIMEVILDVDSMEVGICGCNANGEVTLLGRTGPVENAAELKKQMLGGQSRNGIFYEEWKKQLNYINEQLEKYYKSYKQMDAAAFHIPSMEIVWNCSQLAEQFRAVDEALEKIFVKSYSIIESRKIDEDTLRFLVIGEEAQYYPFTMSIKSYFSYTPFMADERFAKEVICKNAEALAREVEQKREQSKQIGYDIEFTYFELTENNSLMEKREILSEKTQSIHEFKQIKYSQPVFVEKEGTLNFLVNGKVQKVKMPFSNRNGIGDNVEVGLSTENQKLQLRVRRAGEARHYDVELF